VDLINIQKTYAKLLVDVGLNLQPGQKLRLSAETVHAPFLKYIAEYAYQKGAAYVDFNITHSALERTRIDYSQEKYLDYLPPYVSARVQEWCEGDWTFLRVDGAENPDVLKGIDQKRNAIASKKMSATNKPLMNKIVAHYKSWCVAAAPTVGWAKKVFPKEASSLSDEQLVDKLWSVLLPILRLDKADPVQAWEHNQQLLWDRVAKMTSLNIEKLKFKAPGTDLEVSFIPGCHWAGGGSKTEAGVKFLPNIPTEEVFTSPHKLKTTGRAQVTRPVSVLGGMVTGAWFEFKEGRVENYGATDGKDFLDSYFEIDPRARYLGEVALVDAKSPVFSSGRVFENILFDENAACHIALGSAYPLGFEDHDAESLESHGFNQSVLHTDFMIGCPEISVSGIRKDGSSVSIIERGLFTI